MPQAYWIIPLEGGHPDNSLPGYTPGHGRPVDPGYGRPIYHPGHPSHGLPIPPNHVGGGPIYHPGHPDHGLPSQPIYGTGQPVPPDMIDPPLPADLPEPYADKVIVAIKRPDVVEWRVTAYDAATFPGQGLPPTAQPK